VSARLFATKLGRRSALVDESGHLVQIGNSHAANARWAAKFSYSVAPLSEQPEQIPLFDARLLAGASQ
jgi:hypothetical protein